MMMNLKVASLLLLAVCIWGNPFNEIEPTGEQNAEAEVEESADGSGELHNRGEATVLPNIGYLFQGYNIIRGNPLSPKGYDPGFTRDNIFQAEYTEKKKTYDGRYSIPDHTDGTKQISCTMTASAETLKTETQYKDTLAAKASASVKAGGGVWSASFAASTEYNRVSEQLKTNQKSVIKSESTCTVYGASLNTFPPPKFTENFFNNLKALGKENPDYYNFLDTFGTHFVKGITMGSRYSKMQTMSKENEEKLQKEGIDVDVTASASLIGTVDAEISVSVKKTKEDIAKFSKSVEETTIVTFGSKPPKDGKPETWMASAFKNPYPVHYKLRSILDVFKPQYFIDTPEVKYKEIKKGLENFLKGYCKQYTERHPNLKNVECEGPQKGCGGGSICSANAICEDLKSGKTLNKEALKYKCTCKKGYKGNGRRCEHIPKWITKKVIRHEDTKGTFGTWGGMQYCQNGVFADGFVLRAQKYVGSKKKDDDTGANAVCILCNGEYECSKKGSWGKWSDPFKCHKGSFLYGWRQNVEPWKSGRDDTSLNNVEYKCKNMATGKVTKTMKANGHEWGSWSRFQGCPNNQFICGINTKVEDPNRDNTALNDIEHQCCEMDLSNIQPNKRHQKRIGNEQ
eukprot:Seg626.10 transcript_id=Seg626.10/GoldUCD/mRNA.D3Y31 product="Vitelline membrane outer layer protein 1" protein_id=Seg626.10/GoldUCD/D3Y31